MKYANQILIVLLFIILIGLIVAFSSIYPFSAVGYGWQCIISGFVGLLLVICLLIEAWKKDVKSNGKSE